MNNTHRPEMLESLTALTADVVRHPGGSYQHLPLVFFPNTALACDALAYPDMEWSRTALADLEAVASWIAAGYPAAAAVLAEVA